MLEKTQRRPYKGGTAPLISERYGSLASLREARLHERSSRPSPLTVRSPLASSGRECVELTPDHNESTGASSIAPLVTVNCPSPSSGCLHRRGTTRPTGSQGIGASLCFAPFWPANPPPNQVGKVYLAWDGIWAVSQLWCSDGTLLCVADAVLCEYPR